MDVSASGEPRRYPGESGLWIFIFADLGLFGLYFLILANDIGQSPALFQHGSLQVHAGIGLANTLILLTSSWLVVIAVRRDVIADGRSAPLLFAGAAAGSAFLVLKAVEYKELIDRGATILSDNFFMWYFILTGLHALHATAGIILLACCALDRRRSTPRLSPAYVEGAACYWHMVDLLWIVIFTMLYLI